MFIYPNLLDQCLAWRKYSKMWSMTDGPKRAWQWDILIAGWKIHTVKISIIPKVHCVCAIVSDSWQPRVLQPTRLLSPWDSPGKNTEVVCHSRSGLHSITGVSCPPPGDLPHSGIKPVSPALQVDSLLLSHWGSPPRSIRGRNRTSA